MDLVEDYITQHEGRMPRYIYLENLYEGFHDVFKLPEKENWKPDNRLAVNFPKFITDVFLGFAYGIPVKKKHPDEKVNDAISDFDKTNRIADHDFEMAKNTCKYGHAFEYMYQDEDRNTRVSRNTPKELFVVYENSLRRAAYFAVRYGYKDDGATKYGEVITPAEIKEFEGSKFINTRPNPYGKINVVEWIMNEERMSLYECISGMTELFNKTIGEKANDVESFAEAYLAILGAEVDEEGVHRIRDDRIINMYGTDDAKEIVVQFLQKPTADGTQENLLDRLERLMHKISMVSDINSESFGNASGIALEYKLQPMKDLAENMDRKTLKSMSKRYKLFCTLANNVTNKDAWADIEYRTARNLPKNKLEEAQTAASLEGIVSKETQLSVLSVVPDVAAELEKIEKENTPEETAMDRLLYNLDNKGLNNE
jgi:SPP1 family phage portal protein